MTNEIVTDPHTVSPGQIRFFDAIEPPLPAGMYTLSAKQEINNVGAAKVTDYGSDQPLLVEGPQFSIGAGQIHAVFPPANQTGIFDDALPNVVFNSFSLPWARSIKPPVSKNGIVQLPAAGPTPNTPWMGLLTLYPEDMTAASGTAPVGKPFRTTVAELKNPGDKSVLAPALGPVYVPDDTQLMAVDIDIQFFRGIAPTLDELIYLAHARAVNTDGKVMLGMDEDGCFSLLIGNRLPKSAAKNNIYIVSYEGHQDHLRGSAAPDPKYKTIRLVLLGSWEFTASASRGSFVNLMEDLCKQGRGGVKLIGMECSTETAADPLAKEALETGYMALQNKMRSGEDTTSWYRAPLVPAPTKRDFSYGPYIYSDHAIHYDPESGLFNHAYSAAWQIGRLLALSDGQFSQSFFNWRNDYLQEVGRGALYQDVAVKAAMIGTIEEIEADGIVPGMQSFMANKFPKVDWPKIKTRAEVVRSESLPGIFTGDERNELFRADEDPLLKLIDKINS